MKTINNIKSVVLVVAFCLAGVVANAQIYISTDDDNHPRATSSSGFVVPELPGAHDSTLDYTPIGNGLLVLGSLAGAYFLGKRKKHDNA